MVRRGLGGVRLARFWKFFALSAPPRETWAHASGMMSFAFSHTRHTKIPALDLPALSRRSRAPCGPDLIFFHRRGLRGSQRLKLLRPQASDAARSDSSILR
jgi:hypothetical protein